MGDWAFDEPKKEGPKQKRVRPASHLHVFHTLLVLVVAHLALGGWWTVAMWCWIAFIAVAVLITWKQNDDDSDESAAS